MQTHGVGGDSTRAYSPQHNVRSSPTLRAKNRSTKLWTSSSRQSRDILDTCAYGATYVAFRGPHHHPLGIRGLADASAPSLQRLALDLYDTAASQAADGALRVVGGRLAALELYLYGGSVLPCDGIRSCTILTELRLQLSMDPSMHIGPFKYGSQPYLNGSKRRRGGGGGSGVLVPEWTDWDSRHRPQRRYSPLSRAVPSAAAAPLVVAGVATAGSTASDVANEAMPIIGDDGGGGGDDSSGDGSGGNRPVPPAVAAIASLTQLRCLELCGSSIDRILDPPYRLLGLTALRNLKRLRIDLPADTTTLQERFRSGGGGGAMRQRAGIAAEGGGGAAVAATAAANPSAAGVASGWRLGPTLAALTWLQDLDLGVSYELPPEALPSLSTLSQLTRLACGTILTPPPQHPHQSPQQHNLLLPPLQPQAPWLPLPPAPQHEQHFDHLGYAGQRQHHGHQPSGRWLVFHSQLPASLEHLQVASLPAVPVLATLAALPRLKTLTIARRTDTHGVIGDSNSGYGRSGESQYGKIGRTGGDGTTVAAFQMAAAAVGFVNSRAAGDVRTALERPGGMEAGPADAADTIVRSSVIGGASAAQADALNGGYVRQATCKATTSSYAENEDPVGVSSSGGGDCQVARRSLGVAVDAAPAVAPAAAPSPAASSAATAAAATVTPTESLRLTLVGEEFSHTDRLLVASAGRSEEVAVAAALLQRLLPPAALRRVALQPFGRSPAAMLEGPHAAWLAELAPLGFAVEAVELAAFALEPGDLGALRTALPNLKVLSLYVCRLDPEDVRQLQEPGKQQRTLLVRVDSSCKYNSASAYGMYGETEYGAAALMDDGGGSEEFVDEAEALDPDPDFLGFLPVAAELQRAYERALDETDDDEEVDEEEEEIDEADEEQEDGGDGGADGGEVNGTVLFGGLAEEALVEEVLSPG